MKIRVRSFSEQFALNAEKTADKKEAKNFHASLEGYKLSGDTLSKGFHHWPVAGAVVTVDGGVQQRGRHSLTRVGVGTVLLPGVGTVIGGMSRKAAKTARIYVSVELADTAFVIDVAGKDEADARKFAAVVNAAGRHYSEAS